MTLSPRQLIGHCGPRYSSHYERLMRRPLRQRYDSSLVGGNWSPTVTIFHQEKRLCFHKQWEVIADVISTVFALIMTTRKDRNVAPRIITLMHPTSLYNTLKHSEINHVNVVTHNSNSNQNVGDAYLI
ncbi:hypothetical protein AVEN_189194-1 [Araneus ventricosus]|uniref:Uncharacterized protein n=1 Tax=Araneus ventricosus TaxID=182803 RepID=A0A4Y2KFM4_ARAVE|nr:hypothetical protein AVEN_189194-1 [Araneus ventricosus]